MVSAIPRRPSWNKQSKEMISLGNARLTTVVVVVVAVVSGMDYRFNNAIHHGVESIGMVDANKVKARRDETERNERKANNLGTPCNHLDITHIKWSVPSCQGGPVWPC